MIFGGREPRIKKYENEESDSVVYVSKPLHCYLSHVASINAV